MTLINSTLVSSCIAISLACCTANADEWTTGIGVYQASSEYKGSNSQTMVVPLIVYYSDTWSFTGIGVQYAFYAAKSSQAYLELSPRFQGFEQDLSRYTKGMDKRKHALEAALGIDHLTDYGVFSVKWAYDISSVHKGSELFVAYSVPFETKTWEITPVVFARGLSEKYVDYYYGIRKHEVTSNRAAYVGQSALNYGASLDIGYNINKDWRLGFEVTTEVLADEIKKSPLIDTSTNTYFGASILYTF